MGLFSDTYIHTLQLRRSEGSQVPSRPTIEQCIRGIDIHPPGLPPSAVLVIRRLPDPLPGDFRSGSMSPRWEQRVRQALRDLYQQAARPHRGNIPPGVEVIVFQDRAELLACLALDLARGEAPGRWWWHTILRTLKERGPDGLFHLLIQEPACLSAVLNHLAVWGHAGPVLRKISPNQTVALLAMLRQFYGVGGLDPADGSQRSAGSVASGIDTKGEEAGTYNLSANSLTSEVPPSPWPIAQAEMIPEGLSPTATILLGTALSLSHQPDIIRQPKFRQAVARWQNHLRLGVDRVDRKATKEIPDEATQKGNRPASAFAPARSGGDASESAHWSLMSEDSRGGGEGKVSENQSSSERAPTDPKTWLKTHSTPRENRVRDLPARGAETDPGPRPKTTDVRTKVASSAVGPTTGTLRTKSLEKQNGAQSEQKAFPLNLAEGISTRLAGVFYLVNLMTFLDLPASLETACDLGYSLSAWALLGDIGRGLLGENEGVCGRDPVWEMATALAQDLEDPLSNMGVRFQIPAAWLNTPPKQLLWSVDTDRLYIWTRTGALLLDTSLGMETYPAEADIMSALESAFHPVFHRARPVISRAPIARLPVSKIEGDRNLSWWTTRLLPYVRQRLLRQLGVAAEVLAETLLYHPGKLYLTATHLDIVMTLDEISVPVRRAGLDIDPGWVPAFGRIIKFHYR